MSLKELIPQRRFEASNFSRIIKNLLFGLILISCTDHQGPEKTVPEFDSNIFKKLALISNEGSKIWSGYDYVSTDPCYLILMDDHNKTQRGYMLNAPFLIAQSGMPVSKDQSGGLDLRGGEKYLKSAQDTLQNFYFSIDGFRIEGQVFVLVRNLIKPDPNYNFYLAYKDYDHNAVPLILIHEAFHRYQNVNWKQSYYPLDFYPPSLDMITHELYLFNQMIDAYHISKGIDALTLLKRYVVLMDKIREFDSSPSQAMSQQFKLIEMIEGSARYIEHFAASSTIYPTINNDPTHGWKTALDATTSSEKLKNIFGFREWYHVGAGTIHLLKLLGVPVEQKLRSGLTPYDVAASVTNLTSQERKDIYLQMTSTEGWTNNVKQAKYLFGLIH